MKLATLLKTVEVRNELCIKRYICLDGKAVITGENYEKEIKKGDYFYLPYVAEGKFTVSTKTCATLIACLPSKQN